VYLTESIACFRHKEQPSRAVSENADVNFKNRVKIYKHPGCPKYRVFDVKPGRVFTNHLASKG
jgi:hypothetical protein